MVDTLAFLKNDYTEEEIHKLIDEINAYVTFFGGYGATLLKTTNAAIYREKKEDFEVPEEIVLGKLSEDMLAIQQKLDEKKDTSPDEFLKLLSSSECNELMKARDVIIDSYLTEHGGYSITEYEPNKYVINARLNVGAHRDLASLLENMGIEYTDIVQWWGDEFDQNTAFVFINYEPKEIEMNTYNFWLADTYTDEEIEDMQSKLTKVIKQIRYGIYSVHHSALRFTSDVVVKVPVLDEYKKFRAFESNLFSELWEKAMSSGEADEKKWHEVNGTVEKEAAAYCDTHHIFDERAIKQGQIVLPIHILDADIDEVKSIIEIAGYSLAFYSLDDYNCMAEIDFEHF